MLFDGAGGVAAVDAVDPPPHPADVWVDRAGGAELLDASAASFAPTQLVVIDASVQNPAVLVAGLPQDGSVQVLWIQADQDGLQALAGAMAGQTYASIHLLSHGESGQIQLGNRALDASNLGQYAGELAQIGAGLTPSGDLLLYGCDVAQGSGGMAFLQALAQATQADVAGSTDRTGAARLGADWELEASTGSIEARLPINATALANYDEVLAAAPSATIAATSQRTLIGDSFNFNVRYDNTDPVDTGYAPYINLFVPFNGRDGNGTAAPVGNVSREGATITGATYLGQALTVTELTLSASDITNGTVANHPYFRDTGGGSTISIPVGMQAGDKLYVVQLPFGSFTPGQPPVDIAVQGRLGEFADLNQPLDIRVQGGFRYGNDALDNPATDPSIQGAIDTLTLQPALYTVTTTYIGPENETATGSNFTRAYRIDVNVANGQTLTNLQLSQILQDEANANQGLRFAAITGTPSSISGVSLGAAPGGSWTNVGGVLVSQAASNTTTPAVDGNGVGLNNGGTIARTISSITGAAAAIDASMVVQFYVPEFNQNGGPANGNRIFDASSANSTFWNVDTEVTGNWTPSDPDDTPQALSYNSDTDEAAGYAHRLEAEALAIQKTGAVAINVGGGDPTRPTPGDTIEYVLRFQVSDYAAFNDLVITDLISDGQTFEAGFTPTLTVFNNGNVSSTFSGANFTVSTVAANSTNTGTPDNPTFFDTAGGAQNTNANETRTRLVFRVSDQLVTAGSSANLVGDLFNGAAASSGTIGEIRFRTTVNESYVDRPQGAGSNLNLNEGDTLENAVTADGAVLDTALNATGNREFDDSSTQLRIDPNTVDLEVYARNGSTDNTNGRLNRFVPGDTVTYRLRYEVPTGDFDNFNLQAYLPLPVLQTVDANGDGIVDADLVAGGVLNNFTLDSGGNPAPSAGQYQAGPTHFGGVNLPATGGVSTSANSNGILFDFGSRTDAAPDARQIDILFTVRASDRPFADGLFLTALAQQDGANTPGSAGSSQDIGAIQLTAPELNISKGVVRDDVSGVTTFTRQFRQDDTANAITETTVVGTAGTASGLSALLSSANRGALDSDLVNADDSDIVRYAVVIENTGRADSGAYDIRVRDTLPAGYISTDVSNFRITTGDGTVVYDGSSFANVRNGSTGVVFTSDADVRAAFFGADGIEIVDPSGPVGRLGPGKDNAGATINDGTNLLAITYDLQIAGAEASLQMTSSATLFNYAGQEGGSDYTFNYTTSTQTDLSEEATVTIANADVSKTVVATSQPNDVSSGSNVVIGEYVTYEVVITVPQGGHDAAVFTDVLNQGSVAGQVFVSVDSIAFTGGLSSSTGSPAAILAQANDNSLVDGSGIDAAGGFEDRGLTINFGVLTNSSTNNSVAETITIRYTTLVVNRSTVQGGTGLTNSANLTTSLGSQDTAVATVTVREPAWTIAVTPDNGSADFGDTVTFTVTVTGGGNAPGFTGVVPSIVLPSGLTYTANSFQLQSASAGVVTTVDGVNRSATIDRLDAGETAVFTFTAVVDGGVPIGNTLTVPARVNYSSLPDDPDNTGTLSALLSTNEDSERTGADGVGGALNDYARTDNGSITITADQPILTIVQTSEPLTTANGGNPSSPQTAENISGAPGEIIRYRAIVRVPEASALNAEFVVSLANGLQFLNDGSATIALIADGGGLVSTSLTGAGLEVADGTADGSASTAADIRAIRPSFVFANSGSGNAIANGTTNPSGAPGTGTATFASGDDVRFVLGTLDNVNNDADGEWVVVEFNAVVVNQLSNQDALGGVGSATALPVSFSFVSSAVNQGTSDIDTVTVREPILTAADKRVVSVVGNTVTFEVSITNSGTEEAHNLRIFDTFAGATNLTFGSVIGGSLPPGSTDNSSGSAADISVDTLAAGATITVRYTATIADVTAAVPSRDAVITATSLSVGATTLTVRSGEDGSGAPIAGVAVSNTTGERTGADGSGAETTVLNNYSARDGAGLGVITGRLWDDTLDFDQVVDTSPAENPLQGVTVTLLWAGANGTFGNGDDQTFTTTTDANGRYNFALLPAGNYRISVPTTVNDATSGPVIIYMDRANGTTATTGANGQDGLISLALPEGTSAIDRDFGFIKQNATPTITAPATRSGNEDSSFTFTAANSVSVGDPDLAEGANPAVAPSNFLTTLSVTNGTLNVPVTAGVVITGAGTANMTLTGSIADINTALTGLSYTPTANFAGADTLVVRIDDRGNIGDADGDRVPNETVQDNLFATRNIAITVNNTPDPPIANNDARTTTELVAVGGQAINPNAGQITAGDAVDTDPDLPYGDSLTVCGLRAGTDATPITNNAGVGGAGIAGTYGTLVLNADGTYTFTPNPAATNPIPAGSNVTDIFTYTICDSTGNAAVARITITITGQNDPVAAQPDVRTMGEDDPPITGNAVAGNGVAGGQPGDVLDPDPDGNTVTVQGVVAGNNNAVHTTGVGTGITGTYGSLVLNANGTYTYTPGLAAQAIPQGTTAQDVFSYTVNDGNGSTATTTITINIVGSNDALNANPDLRAIAEPNPGPGNTVTGNVILGGQVGEQADVDADGDPMVIQGAVVGNVPGPHTSVIPVTIAGTYGSVQLSANGGYVYTPNANAQTIRAGQVVNDVFTYTINDGNGNQASTTLTIRITGANDPPLANPDANSISSTATTPRTGNLIAAGSANDQVDTDPDVGDVLSVQGVVAGNNPASHTTGVGSSITGTYGAVTVAANGSYSYLLNAANPAVQALAAGQTLTETFSYTINDGNGGVSTSTLTITINGANDPPSGTDKTFTVAEDTPVNLVPADFGFTDPDAGDTFKAVRIDTLPTSGTLIFNGAPVTAGQVIQLAQLNTLQYVPALNANNSNLPAAPSFTFSVCDNSGDAPTQFDPSPNRITINLIPINDPPTAPTITVTIDQNATPGSPACEVGPVLPAPSDPDLPAQTLTITVDTVPPASAGRFVLADGSAVVPGQVLTQQQLQALCFVPNPLNPIPVAANGLIPSGALTFTVLDGNGGGADGAINANVRPFNPAPPPAPPLPPILPPAPPIPPIPAPPPTISFVPPPVERLRLEDPRQPNDFDPFVPWFAGPPIQGAERVAMVNEKAAEATKPVVQAKDDCVPEPKAKVKPKAVAVKRSVFVAPGLEPARPFSEQLQAAKKRFVPPVKVVPKPTPQRDC